MKKIIFFLLILCFSFPSMASGKNQALDSAVWVDVMEDVDYLKDIKEKEEPEKKKEKKSGDSPFKPAPKINRGSNLVQTIAYVLGIILILVIVVWIISRFRTSGKIQTVKRIEATSLEEAEENLPEVALNSIYQEAIDGKKFKQAMRIKFLMVLQEMIDRNMIRWKKSKTNINYLNELKSGTLQAQFGKIVEIFDDVWYGAKELTEDLFNDTVAQIEQINELIHQREN